MKKSFLLTVGLLCTMFICAQVSNDNEDGVYKVDQNAIKYRQGEVIVKFKPSSTANARMRGAKAVSGVSRIDEVLNTLNVTEIEELMPQTAKRNVGKRVKSFNGQTIEVKDMSKMYRLKFEESNTKSVYEIVESLKTLDDVEFAEPNYLAYIQSDGTEEVTYNDPLFPSQWNIPAVNLNKLWAMPKITSKRSVIAILDTGVDITHPDLAANIWTNNMESKGQEEYDDDGNGFKDDVHGWDFVNQTSKIRDNNGHGTHCAGIAGAVGDNGIGIVGANPDALIMPVTVMQSDGTGDIATIIKGLDYASANGADVINMSFGTYATSIAFEQALSHAYANAVLVAAAGNEGHTIEQSKHCYYCINGGMPCFPAAYSFVLGVESSSTADGQLEGYSNYDNTGHIYSGWDEDKLYNYELRAPGSNILSTYPGGKYKALNGTSMACPLAAGAISHLLKLKEYDSKEILFGDLIHASGSGNLNIYAAYLMSDQDRQPELELVSYRIDDSVYGDGDGRLDAGETVDIYPIIRNVWGQAKNIKFSIALAENEDPSIITILNNNVDFGSELSGYAKNTSASPIRIKVKDDCADGRHISLVIKATCTNISSDLAQDVVLTTENGVELGGMITEDMTLFPNVHYIVTSTIAIPYGVTLTIKPGVTLKFKSGTGFACSGKIIAIGEPGNMITFTCSDELSQATVDRFVFSDPVKYAIFDSFYGSGSWNTWHFFNGSFEHCVFKNNKYSPMLISGTYTSCTFCDNYCNGSYGMWDSGDQRINLCNFINNSTSSLNDYNIQTLDAQYATIPRNSNIFSNYLRSYADRQFNLSYYETTPQVYDTKNCNYLGSSLEGKIRMGLLDMYNPYTPTGYGLVDFNSFSTQPSSGAHGIVWKILVNGTDAQDEFEELSPLGVGRHRFDVYFNRPMNKNVAPTISMGVRPPYTQVGIAENGKWNSDGKIYTAYVTITGKTKSDGLNRIYVYGAQDDEFFDIPEEKSRFNVEVQAAGSMATGLVAEAGLGKVSLNWETRESNFEDLLGFNIYRYTDANPTQVKINSELIEPGAIEDGVMEQTFVDYNVTPGTTYYYIVKEMSTDLSQNEISNPVAVTPLTAEKGDANGSMTVDVADVMTEVLYLTGENPQPFIYEAADVNEDTKINILDVVGTVNLIFSQSAAGVMSTNNSVVYTVEDGVLYVESTTPLGGVQVSIQADKDSELTCLSGLDGLEYASAWLNDNEYMLLAYSMSGKSIPSGKQPLLRVGDANVKNMVVSDTFGKNVLAINGSATSITELPFGITDMKNADVRYFDLTGRAVNAQAAKKSGIYIQSIYVDGKCVKSYKLMNK